MLQYLIACPLVPLAGLADSTAGDGGFTVLPAYLITRVPAHVALGTSKLSPTMGTTVSTARLAKYGFLRRKMFMVVCSSAAALVGSALGTHLVLMVPESVVKHMIIVVLPAVAFHVLRNKDIGTRDRAEDTSRDEVFTISTATTFSVGGYDGSYGSGTGTFLILIPTRAAGMGVHNASAQTKMINLLSSIAVLATLIATGSIYYPLGLTADMCSITGHYTGASMVAHGGQKMVRPVVLAVLGVLFIKIISNT